MGVICAADLSKLQSALHPNRPYSGYSNGASHRPSPHCASCHVVVTTSAIHSRTSAEPFIVVSSGIRFALRVLVSSYASEALLCKNRMAM